MAATSITFTINKSDLVAKIQEEIDRIEAEKKEYEVAYNKAVKRELPKIVKSLRAKADALENGTYKGDISRLSSDIPNRWSDYGSRDVGYAKADLEFLSAVKEEEIKITTKSQFSRYFGEFARYW